MENAHVESDDEAEENGKIPTLNLSEIFGMPEKRSQDNDGDSNKKRSDGKKAGSEKKLLSTYCSNLNEKARQGKIDRIIGRDREIDRMIQILSRRQKNNPTAINKL